jgi:hypothetical protein
MVEALLAEATAETLGVRGHIVYIQA